MIDITLYGDPDAFRVDNLQQDRILHALCVGLEELLQDGIPVPVGCNIRGVTRTPRLLVESAGTDPSREIRASIVGGFNWGFVLGEVVIDCEVASTIAKAQDGCTTEGCGCAAYEEWYASPSIVGRVLCAVREYLTMQGPEETSSVQVGFGTSCEEDC